MNNLQAQSESLDFLNQFNLLANQVVEGFISGIHKSPFHGFSSEFAEHKLYNPGETTKNIDWKVYAKTDKLFVKTYDDETNMRCYIILDNSSSMHYPALINNTNFPANKIQYAALTAAAILKLIKKQRDAAGLTIFSNQIDFTIKEQGNEKHHRLLIEKLNETCTVKQTSVQTNIARTLHEIAEKIHKRSLVILFSDMFYKESDQQQIIEALLHLKHNKNKIIIFHIIDRKTEIDFDFLNESKKFIDIETNEIINIHTEQYRENYTNKAQNHLRQVHDLCRQYQVEYKLIDIKDKIEKALLDYFTERQRFK